MALEIERKFLVCNEGWRAGVHEVVTIRQGYFCHTEQLHGRVRAVGTRGFITFKSEAGRLVRHEYEYEIPLRDAVELIARCSMEPPVVKQRHLLNYGGMLWSVDVFEEANAGLVMAEVELRDAAQSFDRPDWAGEDVTLDARYGNANLARTPFGRWAL